MREEKLPLESEFLLFKIIMEVNGMTPKDLANFYVETAFNSRSKLKLSKYGIYGIDFPKENLDKDIDEFNESEELEGETTDSQDLLSDDFDVDQNNNNNDDDSEDKPEEDDPDDFCPF